MSTGLNAHTINRCLRALAATASKGTFYFVYQNGVQLTTKSFANGGWTGGEESVGPAKSGSPAAYLVDGSGEEPYGIIFYLDSDNKLSDYEYSNGTWSSGTLNGVGFVAHEQTRIACVEDNSGTITVYAHDSSGKLQQLSRTRGSTTWERTGELPATSVPESDLAAVILHDKVSVYYRDQSIIRQCTLESGGWQDAEVKGATSRAPNGRIFATTFDDQNSLLLFEGDNETEGVNNMFQIMNGDTTLLGHVTGRQLQLGMTAQCGWVWRPCCRPCCQRRRWCCCWC